ncbi:MAG: hypothetical protein Q4A83_08875, partial [Bacillota bacterium]|nr:hypothetical protein [Bacillota bacterium]
MTKTAKSTKLLFAFVVVLAVMLIAAFSMSAQANAEALDVTDDVFDITDDVIVEAASHDAIDEVIDSIDYDPSPIPGEDDWMSYDGENFEGGPHWYLHITHYSLLPDDFTITLWSDLSAPNYYQTLTKADLMLRGGIIRIPAAVPVYVTSSNGYVEGWAMMDPTAEGAALLNPATGLWDEYDNLWCPHCGILEQAHNFQQIHHDTAVIWGIPVGDHNLHLHVI